MTRLPWVLLLTSCCALPLAAATCASCDVPEALSFCKSFVSYSACRSGGSWKDMDTIAEQQYKKLLNGSSDAVGACGSEKEPLTGVSGDGKCFDTDYDGPARTAWIIGFAIAVVFSFLASVGINLQKKALKQNELGAEPVPAYRLPLWVLGFVLCAVGSVLDFVAFGLAPQSLLAPLAALTLVWNMMLAPCFNKEKLSKKDIVSTLIIFVGATIAVVFASHATPTYNLDMLLALYRDPLTIVYFCVVFLTVVAHYAAIKVIDTFCLMSKRHRIIQVGTPAVWATIRYLNGGLVHYDALSMVPVYQAYWVISGVLGGVIYFQEIRTFSVLQAVMFVLGIGISIFGVVLLSRRKHAPSTSTSKGKIERGFSFTSPSDSRQEPKSPDSRLPRVSEASSTNAAAAEQEVAPRTDTARELLSSILEVLGEDSNTEESDVEDSSNDRRSDNDMSEHANRQAIDNYLDMSTTVGLSEILGSLGLRSTENGLLSRRMSSRSSSTKDKSKKDEDTPRKDMV
uniref:EamA domain-containing protein n=1 Tax=Phytophthora ramorum TaxID=164328 RepID=H3H0U5_PHYRM